jgi:hypothetical protein
MRNKNNSEKFSKQQLWEHMAKELILDSLPEQHRMNKLHKVKGGPPSRD